MKPRSAETELRYLRSNYKKVIRERKEYHDEAYRLRNEVVALKQELSDWKERFDILLRKEAE